MGVVLPFVRKEKCGMCAYLQSYTSDGSWGLPIRTAYFCNTNRDKEWRKVTEPACPLFEISPAWPTSRSGA
jgi:hypothetical protein